MDSGGPLNLIIIKTSRRLREIIVRNCTSAQAVTPTPRFERGRQTPTLCWRFGFDFWLDVAHGGMHSVLVGASVTYISTVIKCWGCLSNTRCRSIQKFENEILVSWVLSALLQFYRTFNEGEKHLFCYKKNSRKITQYWNLLQHLICFLFRLGYFFLSMNFIVYE